MGYKTPKIYTLTGGAASSNPAVTTTYYIGYSLGATLSTSETSFNMTLPKGGNIRFIDVYSFATVAGTAEDWTMLLRNVTTATDYTIALLGVSASNRDWINNNLMIPVAVGDKIVIKTTTPNWVTPPASVRFHVTIGMDCE
jgi:hypothetical protein